MIGKWSKEGVNHWIILVVRFLHYFRLHWGGIAIIRIPQNRFRGRKPVRVALRCNKMSNVAGGFRVRFLDYLNTFSQWHGSTAAGLRDVTASFCHPYGPVHARG